jgi:positive regulator of sigma E activity
MIEQNVQVLKCSDELLWVRMGSQAGCAACNSGIGCGAGLFAKLLQRKPVVLQLARNGISVEAGQMLTLAFPERLFIKLVFAAYGWPLLATLAGAYAGYAAGSWLQLNPLLLDMATLAAGGLAAWIFLRFISSEKIAETVLNSLSLTVCFSADTPNMCNATPVKPERF